MNQGEFLYINDLMDRTRYRDMYAAITKANAWADLAEEKPCLNRILKEMNYTLGYTSKSIEQILQTMKEIAKYGWDLFISGK
jgi:D-aminopeptidase